MPFSIATSGIVAQAFRVMEMSPISSFGDDSEEAAAAEDQYPVALRTCLERGEWSFASRTVSLPATVEVSPDPDLPHTFVKPPDFVKLQKVWPAGCGWRVEAERILASEPAPLGLRYTFLVEDEDALGGAFRTAVAYQLAALLSPRWSASANRADALQKDADDFLARASVADRTSASGQRYDGRDAGGDWAAEAVA